MTYSYPQTRQTPQTSFGHIVNRNLYLLQQKKYKRKQELLATRNRAIARIRKVCTEATKIKTNEQRRREDMTKAFGKPNAQGHYFIPSLSSYIDINGKISNGGFTQSSNNRTLSDMMLEMVITGRDPITGRAMTDLHRWLTGMSMATNVMTAGWYSIKPMTLNQMPNKVPEKTIDNSNKIISELKRLIGKGEIKGNNIISPVDNNTQVIFRKDTGSNAHPIRPKYPEPMNHYNVEIQKKTQAGKWKSKESFHIIIDKNGNIIDRF